MIFHDHSPRGFVVMDGRRHVATARPKPGRGWFLRAYGFCWTDPDARKPNWLDEVYPNYLLVRDKRTAERYLRDLARQPK